MSNLCLYFIKPPEKDRWIKGDKYLRSFIRRLLRGKPRPGGVEKVFINLCRGLDQLGIDYRVNVPFAQLKPKDKVAILGAGKHCLDGYNQPNKIVAGIGLMTHPSEWPELFDEYPVVKYLQHSEWANAIYKPYYGDRCEIWPVGIETEKWTPDKNIKKEFDFLIYNKINWHFEEMNRGLLQPIKELLKTKNLKFTELRYGNYHSEEYRQILLKSKAMIFLSEHESQGIAYQEALSSGVPILAWDQGKLVDKNYKIWGDEHKSTSSVPYFDQRCGMKFKNLGEFESIVDYFILKVNLFEFAPRDYILENLTLEKSTKIFLDIVNSVD